MIRFPQKEDWVLLGATILFIGVVLACYGWGTASIVQSFSRAIAPPDISQVTTVFDLETARTLDYHGISVER